MACLCPLLIALLCGLLPELESLEKPPIRGEIAFRSERPAARTKKSAGSTTQSRWSGWSMDWLEENYDSLMAWNKNPWQIKRLGFGDHYLELLASKDPVDIARAKELRRLAEGLHKRLLERYPELAVAAKTVPPERNGFLKWLEFSEQFTSNSEVKTVDFPEDLKKHLRAEAPWNTESVKAWLTQQQPLMDKIRAIGLMPEQSVQGIDVHRWAFIDARMAKSCAEALMLEARLAAEQGNATDALESIQAANGIAAHMGNVESPTLLAATVQILIQQQTQRYAFAEIMPALPVGQLDPAVWENVLAQRVSPPSEFARFMKGEWNTTAREYLLPMLVDVEDPKYPTDPEALLDFHAGVFLKAVEAHESNQVMDLPNIPVVDFPDDSHLSRQSRQASQNLAIGASAWRKGWERTQSVYALNQAAFAVMKGQTVLHDPIYGLPYIWDPTTRQLSPPSGEVFKDFDLKPITIPNPR